MKFFYLTVVLAINSLSASADEDTICNNFDMSQKAIELERISEAAIGYYLINQRYPDISIGIRDALNEFYVRSNSSLDSDRVFFDQDELKLTSRCMLSNPEIKKVEVESGAIICTVSINNYPAQCRKLSLNELYTPPADMLENANKGSHADLF